MITGTPTPTCRIWAKECRDCGAYLNATEEHFYENRCERCEGKWTERIEAWRRGGDDEELDEAIQ